MEYDSDDNNMSGNWLERVKQSPRTVSALIIILIVAAAIYAFSGNKQQNNNEEALNPQNTEAEQVAGEATPSVATTTEGESADVATSAQPTVPLKEVSQDDLKKVAGQLPESSKTDSAYVEVAQKGDGLTHLARRATTRYLSENSVGYTVTNEQRIYIEDYVRRQMAQGHVSIGSAHEISFDLMKDAVTKAGQLNEKQLHNLTKYTSALT